MPCISRGQCSTSTTDVQLLGVVVAKIAFIGGDIVGFHTIQEEFNTRGGARSSQGNVLPDIVLRSDTGVDPIPSVPCSTITKNVMPCAIVATDHE